MFRQLIITLVLSTGLAAASVSAANAQVLDPGAGASSGLQSQTGQTQTTTEALNQTGSVQTNNTQSTLSQSSSQPLEVVSDPKQTTPDAVALPSTTLKTDITETGGSNTGWYILGGLLAFMTLLTLYYIFKPDPQERAKASSDVRAEPAPVIRPEPIKPPKKRSKQPKNKRKKSSRR
jgi:LPXTG-motif cell wall-anchored protein